MKKYLLLFIFTLFFFIPNIFNSYLFAQTQEQIYEEVIDSFKTEIVVNPDNTINVTETIDYNFKDLEKHGIFRYIPLSRAPGTIRNLKIKNIRVTDPNGSSYNFEETNDGEINIKIGDANILITGLHTYVISYTAINSIGYFNDLDEIYWNATGNGWEIPILDAETHVYLPGDLTNSNLKIASYCGLLGSQDSCINGIPIYNNETNQTEVIFKTPDDFYYDTGEGMTVAVGFPKGTVIQNTLEWYEKPTTYIHIAYGLIIFFILLFLHLIFIKFIPEYRKRKRPIVAEFDAPKDILPSQAGLIYNLFGLGNSKILTADILYLASLGYIKIENKLNEFYITRIDGKDISLLDIKSKLLLNLVSKENQTVSLSEIEGEKRYDSFKNYINQIKSEVEKNKVKSRNILRSIVLLIMVIIAAPIILAITEIGINIPKQIFIPLGILIAGFIIYRNVKSFINWRLSKMTDAWYSVAGLHRYIKIAEKNRIQFESDPNKAQQIFSLLLPYAVAFGLEGKWIKVFDGIMVNPPDWYSGGSISTMSYSIGAFAGAMSSTSNAGAPVSSGSDSSFGGSSGGGSSGGGGGGGGGGSW